MSRVKIKEYAKGKVKSNLGDMWKGLIIVYLAQIIITSLVSTIFDNNSASLAVSIISNILIAPISIGLLNYISEVLKGKKPDIKCLFNYYDKFLNIAIMTVISSVLISFGFILLIIPGIYLALSYALAPYIFMKNKETDPIEALKQSRQKMNGHRLDLLIFGLSFLGWILLVGITFGIAIIWVGPYMEVATIKYYEQLTD